jgi:hypothetical protein
MAEDTKATQRPDESSSERYTRDALSLASRTLCSFALVFLPAAAIRRRLDAPAARQRLLTPYLFVAAAAWATAAEWRAGWSGDQRQLASLGLDAVVLTALPVFAVVFVLSRLCVALLAVGDEGREPCNRLLNYSAALHFAAAAVGLAARALQELVTVKTYVLWFFPDQRLIEYVLRLWTAGNVAALAYGYWIPFRALSAGMPLRRSGVRRFLFAGVAAAMGFGPTVLYLALFYLGPAHGTPGLSLKVESPLRTWTPSATFAIEITNYRGSEIEVNELKLEVVPCRCPRPEGFSKHPSLFEVGMPICEPFDAFVDRPYTIAVPGNKPVTQQVTWKPSADQRRHLGREHDTICCRASTWVPSAVTPWQECGRVSEIDASVMPLLTPFRPKGIRKGIAEWRKDCGGNNPDTAACAEACAQGDTSSCYDLANAKGVDEKLSRSLYAMGCDAFNGWDCVIAARRWPLSADDGWALLRLDQACERGVESGCEELGAQLLTARGADVSVRTVLERGCGINTVVGCLRLGDYLAKDESSAQAPSAALRAWWRACSTDPQEYSEACRRIDSFRLVAPMSETDER